MSVVHVWGCDCVSISRGRWVCFLVARRPQCPHTWPLRSLPCSAHCTRCTRFSRFQVTRRGREGRDHPMCAAAQSPYTPVLPPSLLLNSSSAHTFKSEMHNSVKSAGVRIYSQAGRGCSTSLRRIHRRAENPRVEVKLARHARASCGLRIDSQERHTPPKHRKWITFSSHSPLCCFSRKMFPVSGWLWWCVTSPYMWTVCGFPLSSQSTKRVAALGCSSYGFGKHNSLHLQNSTIVTLYTCSHVTPCSHTM